MFATGEFVNMYCRELILSSRKVCFTSITVYLMYDQQKT